MIHTMTMKLQAAGLAAPAVPSGPLVRLALAVRRATGFAIVGSGLAVIVAHAFAQWLGA